MTNQKLEIRAAKALKWKEITHPNGTLNYTVGVHTAERIRWPSMGVENGDLFVRPLHPASLLFTTSFDWSLLGLKKCEEKGWTVNLKMRVGNYSIWIGRPKKDNRLEFDVIQHLTTDFEEFKKLVTLAWVEILEKFEKEE